MSSKQKEDKAKKDLREAVNSPAGVGFVLAFSAIAWLLVYSLFTMLPV